MVLSRTDDLDVIGLGGRPRGCVPGLLRPPGTRDGAPWMGRGQGRGHRAPRPRASFLQGAVHGAEEVPKQVLVPAWPVDRDVLRNGSRACGGTGSDSLPARGDEPPPAPDRQPERQGGLPAAQAEASLRLRRPLAGARRAWGRARPAGRAPADRGLRHLEPGHDRQGGLDGRIRGRPAQTVGLPQVRDQERPGTGRFRFHGRGPATAIRPAGGRAGRGAGYGGPARQAASVRVPTRADRGGRGTGTARGGREGSGRPWARHPRHRPRQAPRRGVPAGGAPAATNRARVRGALRAPAHPR